MSEHLNNPEQFEDPLVDDCSNCEQIYDLTPENTYGFHYEDQAECDNLYCICPNCNYRTRIFVSEKRLRQAIAEGIQVEDESSLAPQTIYDNWCEALRITLPPTYELTDRHEALVRKFGENLLVIPNDIFWDNIEAETSRPYPEKWM